MAMQNNRKLASLDELFSIDSIPKDEKHENGVGVIEIPISKLHAKHNHRFQIHLGQKNDDLLQSIQEFGVLEPIIVQPVEDGYEILAGHRRTEMAKAAGLVKIPAVVKEGLTPEEADLVETETNLLQRSWSDMSHSERAAVLYAHYNATSKKGIRKGFLSEINAEIKELSTPVNTRAEGTLSQLGTKGNLRASGEAYELSKNTVSRYLRIYELIDELKDRLDLNEIPFIAGVEVSNLKPEHQKILDEMLETYKLDISKAETLHRLEKSEKLTQESMREVLEGKKINKPGRPKAVRINPVIIKKYFDESADLKEIEKTIDAALKAYFES